MPGWIRIGPDKFRGRLHVNYTAETTNTSDSKEPLPATEAGAPAIVEEDIEITPEMIEAGSLVLAGFDTTFESEAMWAERVYTAMKRAAITHPTIVAGQMSKRNLKTAAA
jgi:hypothetical protein